MEDLKQEKSGSQEKVDEKNADEAKGGRYSRAAGGVGEMERFEEEGEEVYRM